MDRETAEIARKFARRLMNNYTIKKIILFGSRARGDHLKMSDFDFIIVSPDFEGFTLSRGWLQSTNTGMNPMILNPFVTLLKNLKKKRRKLE